MFYEFQRTEMLIGQDNLSKLRNKKVAIFGIGGVGSYVAEALARVGINEFVLVDNDVVSITNINRQLVALHSTISRPKVEVMKERILDINKKALITTYEKFYNKDNASFLIKDDYDYIIDAIDSVASKIDLILEAKKRGIPIISSMGAGNKLNPTMFEVSDIYKTSVCPLARCIRKKLKALGIESLKVVYSKEEPKKAIEGGVPASISFVPSVVGLIIASEVVKDFLKCLQ